jgi:hypothetical protein
MSGKLLRLALGAAFRSASGVQSVSGCVAGPPGTMGELTLNSNTSLTVNPFRAVVQNTQDATAGPYLVPNDAAVTFTTGGSPALPAQDATQFRRAYVVVHVDDAQVAGSGPNQTYLEVISGALAATAVAAAYPAVPVNALLLGELLFPPTGQAVTLTPYNPRTTSRGGILPVLTEASYWNQATGAVVTAGTHGGQAVYFLDTKALGLWDAAAAVWRLWDSVEQSFTPTLSTAGGTPGVGNGTLVGWYKRMGKECWIHIWFVVGTTTNGGTGVVQFNLPAGLAGAAVGANGELYIGAKLYTTSTNWVGVAGINSTAVLPSFPVSNSRSDVAQLASATSGGVAGTGTPTIAGQYTLNSGNSNLSISGIYKLAV